MNVEKTCIAIGCDNSTNGVLPTCTKHWNVLPSPAHNAWWAGHLALEKLPPQRHANDLCLTGQTVVVLILALEEGREEEAKAHLLAATELPYDWLKMARAAFEAWRVGTTTRIAAWEPKREKPQKLKKPKPSARSAPSARVTAAGKKLGRPPNVERKNAIRSLLGTMRDADVAARFGVSSSYIEALRKQQHVPAFASADGRRNWSQVAMDRAEKRRSERMAKELELVRPHLPAKLTAEEIEGITGVPAARVCDYRRATGQAPERSPVKRRLLEFLSDGPKTTREIRDYMEWTANDCHARLHVYKNREKCLLQLEDRRWALATEAGIARASTTSPTNKVTS